MYAHRVLQRVSGATRSSVRVWRRGALTQVPPRATGATASKKPAGGARATTSGSAAAKAAATSATTRSSPSSDGGEAQRVAATAAPVEAGEAGEAAAYHGIASGPFARETADVLLAPLDPADVEVKPDGTVYLPEIKYRRRLNRAFGPGAWAMKPIGTATVTADDVLYRTYQMFCMGRFVAEATGEQQVRKGMSFATAEESAKSNALMRCWCVCGAPMRRALALTAHRAQQGPRHCVRVLGSDVDCCVQEQVFERGLVHESAHAGEALAVEEKGRRQHSLSVEGNDVLSVFSFVRQ